MVITLLEKRRPTTLNQIMGQDQHVKDFRAWMEAKDIPHLILYGPFGMGKSSFIESGLKDYYGKYYYRNVTTKNASQQSVRGIGAMDDIITNELGIMSQGDFPQRTLVFEEAEKITEDGQRSLKRAIEQHAHNTRFVFLTNYFTDMDEGIQERCVGKHFKRPASTKIHKWLTDAFNEESNGSAMSEADKTVINILSSPPLSPRVALKRLGVYITTGFIESVTELSEISILIVDRMFAALRDKTNFSKLYRGCMDIYDSIRPDFNSPEREMLAYIFERARSKYFNSHPAIVGELSKALAASDIAIQHSSNPNIHMSNLLWKFAKAFGGKK